MQQRWKNIRIFISSTFRDMHAERDHLVRVVFPELKEKCRRHRIHLVDVDLRWGVSEADAESGKALLVCLDEIDSCRPHFIGILGHRYGFIPRGEKHSIAAQEIYHGVLHNDVPKQVVDLRAIIEGRLEDRALTNEQISCLVRSYRWDAELAKYMLREDVARDDLKMIQTVFQQYTTYQRNRSYFFFRARDLTNKLAGKALDDFYDADKFNRDKLAELKQEIIDCGLPWFEYDEIDAFGDKVGSLLWDRISSEITAFGEDEKGWLEAEAEFHESFLADHSRRFVGRVGLLDKMHRFCEEKSAANIMVVTGEPGCGKSALMSKFAAEVMQNRPDWFIFCHFVGASPDSTSLRYTLKRVCTYLHAQLALKDEVPEDIKELKKIFPNWLEKVAQHSLILIIIDAADQFEKTDGAHDMQWLPRELPGSVRVVISTVAGEAHDALVARQNKPEMVILGGLKSKDIRRLVDNYMSEIRKAFPNKNDENAFYQRVATGNPLYILVALEELRVFGNFFQLSERIRQLPDNLPDLFDQVLNRIEGDFSAPMVRDCMALIACGRQGMSAEELQDLLCQYATLQDGTTQANKLPDLIWARLYRAFGSYLFVRSGVVDFFHGQLKVAVGRRYLKRESDRNTTHQLIADYFEKRWREPYPRALDELPHQLMKAGDWQGVERVLCDLEFIEAKCMHGMSWSLAKDYDQLSPEEGLAPPIRTAGVRQVGRVHSKSGDLTSPSRKEKEYGIWCPFCLAWSQIEKRQLNQIIDCPACESLLQVNPFCIEAEWHPTEPRRKVIKANRFKPPQLSNTFMEFTDFFHRHIHAITIYPQATLQQAANEPNNSPLALAAEYLNTRAPARNPWFKWLNKPARKGPELMTLSGHTDHVFDCAYSPDGTRIISASWDKTILIWDARTGELIRKLAGHTGNVECCTFSPDGSRIASGSSDKTAKIWDVETGEPIISLQVHVNTINACAFSPDGCWIVTGEGGIRSFDKAVTIWNAQTGENRFSFNVHSVYTDSKSEVNFCVYSPDGSRILVGAGYEKDAIRICDAESGSKIVGFEGHGYHQQVRCAVFSPDGKLIVSVSGNSSVKVWDATTGELVADLLGGSGQIKSCDFSPDGRFIAAGSSSLGLWDTRSFELLGTLKGYPASITALAFSPDGKYVVTAHHDHVLRISAVGAVEPGQQMPGESFPVTLCRFSPEGNNILAVGSDNKLRILSAETQEEMMVLDGHQHHVAACDYAPDGSRIISGAHLGVYQKDGGFKIWDIDTGKAVHTLAIQPDRKENISTGEQTWMKLRQNARTCLYSPDGSKILLSYWEPSLRLLDSLKMEPELMLRGLKGIVESSAFSADGRRIVAGSSDNIENVWDTDSGQVLGNVWDADTGQELCSLNASPRKCAFSPDGRRLVTVNFDLEKGPWSLQVWDMRSVSMLRTLLISPVRMDSCLFTPDGQYIVSSGEDGFLRLWDAESGDLVCAFMTGTKITDADITRAGYLLAVACGAERCHLLEPQHVQFDPPIVTAIRLYRNTYHRWDPELTARCEWCGVRFVPKTKVLKLIGKLTKNLTFEQSPCADLSDDAWDEPRLLSECPSCRQPLRFNPFMIDNFR